ncbi:MAG TPA: hypothetical protein VGR78_17535 [Verrucomicrobiae bacterium]|jgi:hypothetical protein|nr:hypothetical protein [Verrucomicrobiae bacterium]
MKRGAVLVGKIRHQQSAPPRPATRKILIGKEVDMKDSVAMAHSLGDTHGWKERHTTFDLWHLAATWALSAATFLTFDQRQRKIAGLMGMSH